jgi:hypothetical protein
VGEEPIYGAFSSKDESHLLVNYQKVEMGPYKPWRHVFTSPNRPPQ